MISIRLSTSIAALVVLSAASAAADPAYVTSTVNLRSGANTTTEIVAKIPGGSRVEATNCSEWCEVEWQGKKGFAIATALDRSGHAPAPRTAAAGARPAPRRGAPPAAGYVEDEDDYVPVGPPVVYGGPVYGGPVYYGYGPRWGWGYGYRGRRW